MSKDTANVPLLLTSTIITCNINQLSPLAHCDSSGDLRNEVRKGILGSNQISE